jgi:hypothetical protein
MLATCVLAGHSLLALLLGLLGGLAALWMSRQPENTGERRG